MGWCHRMIEMPTATAGAATDNELSKILYSGVRMQLFCWDGKCRYELET